LPPTNAKGKLKPTAEEPYHASVKHKHASLARSFATHTMGKSYPARLFATQHAKGKSKANSYPNPISNLEWSTGLTGSHKTRGHKLTKYDHQKEITQRLPSNLWAYYKDL
jgi:hypothetical protein